VGSYVEVGPSWRIDEIPCVRANIANAFKRTIAYRTRRVHYLFLGLWFFLATY